jgi:lipopolysaccharide export LptBFGC system permease protein LptF
MNLNSREKISRLTNDDLYRILKDENSYSDSYILVIKDEWKLRNLTNEQIEIINSNWLNDENKFLLQKEERKKIPLDWYWKFLFIFSPLPFGIIGIFLIAKYRYEGFEKKYKDSLKYIMIGMLLYIVLIFSLTS